MRTEIISAIKFFLLLAGVSLISCTQKVDTGLDVFKKTDYQSYSVITGKVIKDADAEDRKNIDLVKFEGTKVLASSPKESPLENISCRVLDELRMVAPPPSWTGLHRTLDLHSGQEVLAYVGIKDSQCEVVHISKISDGQIHFPKWKNQEPMTIKSQDIDTYFTKEFNKIFAK
jgi:hypothetical protein